MNGNGGLDFNFPPLLNYYLPATVAGNKAPNESATGAYYQELVARYGQSNLDQTLRYYTIPGFGHSVGYFNAAGGIPIIEALEAWVEHGVAPGQLTVTDMNPGANRTRPMCVYPSWPKYKGTGDINAAANFQCVTQ